MEMLYAILILTLLSGLAVLAGAVICAVFKGPNTLEKGLVAAVIGFFMFGTG
ncbi:MAG: hypothetical protein MI862_26700 [Desulfobacterales bacterium]|nr:hypothetical protein [Desulfobacterales bacterium]